MPGDLHTSRGSRCCCSLLRTARSRGWCSNAWWKASRRADAEQLTLTGTFRGGNEANRSKRGGKPLRERWPLSEVWSPKAGIWKEKF